MLWIFGCPTELPAEEGNLLSCIFFNALFYAFHALVFIIMYSHAFVFRKITVGIGVGAIWGSFSEDSSHGSLHIFCKYLNTVLIRIQYLFSFPYLFFSVLSGLG